MTNLRQRIFQLHYPYAGVLPFDRPDLQGWNSESPTFYKLITEARPRLICEVGTWKGASAIHMASLTPDAEILCIDTWLGSLEHWTHKSLRADLPLLNGRLGVYDTFLRNVVTCCFEDRITPLPLPSNIAAEYLKSLGVKFDLTYIDGSHRYQDVVDDIIAFEPISSLLFGDDYNWPAVGAAVNDAARLFGKRVEAFDEKWVLR